MDILVAHEAAAAPVYSVADVLADPHFQARETVVSVPDQHLSSVRMQAPTPRLSESPGEIHFTGPDLGQHNEEIYRDFLGLSDAQLQSLKAEGVI